MTEPIGARSGFTPAGVVPGVTTGAQATGAE